jgi:hypothetical protein
MEIVGVPALKQCTAGHSQVKKHHLGILDFRGAQKTEADNVASLRVFEMM